MPMRNIRMMPGIRDMQGEKVNTLTVGEMVARHPRPKYSTVCTRCGAQSTAGQDQLTSGAATCKAASCGKASPRRAPSVDDRQRAAQQRADELRALEQQSSDLRMQAETNDYVLPSKVRTDIEDHTVMRDRDRVALRERREAEDAERRESERPAREAAEQAERQRTQREQAQRDYWADAILNGPDVKFHLDPILESARALSATMPMKDAEALTLKSAQEFAASAEYAEHRTPENADAMLGYLQRNGCTAASTEVFAAAFRRLKGLGLLRAKPVPTKPIIVDARTSQSQSPSGPKTYTGRDYATGRQREFTEREVDRMSADEYRRTFAVVPTVAELFTAIEGSR